MTALDIVWTDGSVVLRLKVAECEPSKIMSILNEQYKLVAKTFTFRDNVMYVAPSKTALLSILEN